MMLLTAFVKNFIGKLKNIDKIKIIKLSRFNITSNELVRVMTNDIIFSDHSESGDKHKIIHKYIATLITNK